MYNFIMYVCTHPQLKYKMFSSHTEKYVSMYDVLYNTSMYTAGVCRTWVDSLCFQWEGLVPIIGEYVYWCTVPRYRENLQNRGIHSSDTWNGYICTYTYSCMYIRMYRLYCIYIQWRCQSCSPWAVDIWVISTYVRNYTLPPSAHISVGNYVCYEYTLYTQRERVYIMYVLYVCTCIMNTGDTYVYMYPVYTYTPRMQHIRIILRTICTHSHYDISTVCTNVYTP